MFVLLKPFSYFHKFSQVLSFLGHKRGREEQEYQSGVQIGQEDIWYWSSMHHWVHRSAPSNYNGPYNHKFHRFTEYICKLCMLCIKGRVNQLEKLEAAKSAYFCLSLVTFGYLWLPFFPYISLPLPTFPYLSVALHLALLGPSGPYFAFI